MKKLLIILLILVILISSGCEMGNYKISLEKTDGDENTAIKLCKKAALEKEEKRQIKSQIDYNYKILETDVFETKTDVEQYAGDYSALPPSPVCKKEDTEKYIAVLIEQRFSQRTDVFILGELDKATYVVICDQNGEILETKDNC